MSLPPLKKLLTFSAVRYQLELVDGNNKLQGSILMEVQHASANVVFIGSGTIEADRIRAEPLP